MRDDLSVSPEECLMSALEVMSQVARAMYIMVQAEETYGDASAEFKLAEEMYVSVVDEIKRYDEATQDLIDQILYTYHECWLHGYHPSMPVVVVES